MALRGALTHRKTRWLAESLNIKLPYALGLMEALWHLTSEQTPTGAIGELSDKAIAAEMYWDDEPAVLIDALVKAEILDRDPKHRLIVHGWAERADQTTKRKVARSGKSMVGYDEQKLDMASHELDTYSLPVASSQKPEPDSPLPPSGGSASSAVADPEPEPPFDEELFGKSPSSRGPKELSEEQRKAAHAATDAVFPSRLGSGPTWREWSVWTDAFKAGLRPEDAVRLATEAKARFDRTKRPDDRAQSMMLFKDEIVEGAMKAKVAATKTHTAQPWEAAGMTQDEWTEQLFQQERQGGKARAAAMYGNRREVLAA